jgi:hypothetical protein
VFADPYQNFADSFLLIDPKYINLIVTMLNKLDLVGLNTKSMNIYKKSDDKTKFINPTDRSLIFREENTQPMTISRKQTDEVRPSNHLRSLTTCL